MSKSINRVQLLGHAGIEPEIRHFQSGDKVANFRLATSETWSDKKTGEKKERTEWHNIVIWNQHLIGVVEKYVSKGSRLLITGRLETRSYEVDGQKRYATEIVIRPYDGELILLDHRGEAGRGFASPPATEEPPPPSAADSFQGVNGSHLNELEDEIPF